jgi:hypothetical protein
MYDVLDEFDEDGALREAAEGVARCSRAELLSGAVGAAGVLLGALAAPAVAKTTKRELAILNFDLVFEYMQAGLYTEAERIGGLSRTTASWARVVGAHERAHARVLKKLVGRQAVKKPSFNYRGVTEEDGRFTRTAVAFEDATAALLKGQASEIESRDLLAAVLSLHSVEARHAAWVRHIVGILPAASAFDEPASEHRIERIVQRANFASDIPTRLTRRRMRPRYTG